MLGIPKYKPNFYIDAYLFCEDFRDILKQLIGKSIDCFWIMWDYKHEQWNQDGPIILKIGNFNYEFAACNLNEFSLTTNLINLESKLNWYGSGDELPLGWKENHKKECINLLKRPIKEINIVTYDFTSELNNFHINPEQVSKLYNEGFVLHGIEFVLEKENDSDFENYFSIYNALDQIGIKTTEIGSYKGLQKIQITSY